MHFNLFFFENDLKIKIQSTYLLHIKYNIFLNNKEIIIDQKILRL